MIRVRGGVRTKPHAPIDQLTERAPAEFFAEINGSGNDQRFEDFDRGDSGEFCGIAGNDERPKTFS
nr:hypothetical protein [Microbacterium barkeri]